VRVLTPETPDQRRRREAIEAATFKRFPLMMTKRDAPDVIVDDKSEENEMRAKGYDAPPDDIAGWHAARANIPPSYRRVLWPMWVEPPDGKGRVVSGPEEYEAVMGRPYGTAAVAPSPVADTLADTELAEFRAWQAARQPPAAPAPRTPRAQAFALAKERGLKVSIQWSTERIVKALEEADAEARTMIRAD